MEYSKVVEEVQKIVNAISVEEREKYYIVFDIDETLITSANVSHLFKSKNDIFKWQHKGNFAPIPEMVNLYLWLKQQGLKIALITGRREALERPTVKNLRAIFGDTIDDDLMFFKSKGWKTTEEYKIASRRWIYTQGYEVLVNIGDQSTDISEGFSSHTFLLPSTY